MENNVISSDVSEIPTKSRSLDIQTLYAEKSTPVKEPVEQTPLKRKRRSLVEDKEFVFGQGKRRRKSRKEVSLSSLDTADKKSTEGLNAVDVLKVHGFITNRKNPDKGSNGQVLGGGNLRNSSSLSILCGNLEDNVPIPKRPRGLSRRKKFQKDHGSEEVGTSGKLSPDAEVVNVASDSVVPLTSLEGKKEVFDDLKENSSSRADTAQRLKSEDGASVEHDGNSGAKRSRRNRRKGHKSEPQERKFVEEFEPSVDNSSKCSSDIQDDDEENLEENAARMLSSRFDPSCTGFSGNHLASYSQSPNGFPFTGSPGSNFPACSESNSADAAGRVLRPRKQRKPKGHTRKRRHFYELFFRDLDAYWVLNRRIKVFWPLDQSWYFGLINNYDPETKLHHVKYDDREEEWISLENERFKLLLLPSEVPRKSGSKNSAMKGKHVDKEEGIVDPEDESCMGSFLESEPIISWLARSSRRVKSSPVSIKKKQKTSCSSKNFVPTMFAGDPVHTSLGCKVGGSSRPETNRLLCDTRSRKRRTNLVIHEKSLMEGTARSKDRRLPFVYYRRRFRNRHGLSSVSQETSRCRNFSGSAASRDSVADKVDELGEYYVAQPLDFDSLLWSGEDLRLLKFTIPSTELGKVRLKLRLPLPRFCSFLFLAKNSWVYNHLLLFGHAMTITAWPKVRLEMLFVDNLVGLRFLLFEGCLLQAVSLVCLVLTTFHQPKRFGKFVDMQLPFTSVRFKFSGSLNLERHLVFMFHNYMEVQTSKWQHLDGLFRQYSAVTKHLPLAECTFDNIKVIQCGSNQLPVPSTCGEPVASEGSWRRSKLGVMNMGARRELSSIDTGLSSSNMNEKNRLLPPFVLSFTAAPSLFLSLHLKLLMEKNVASVSFRKHHSPIEDREVRDQFMNDEFSLHDVLPDQINLENYMDCPLSQGAAVSQHLSQSKVETDALVNDCDWINSSKKYGELNVTGTSVGCQDSGQKGSDGTANLQRHPCNGSGLKQHVLGSFPSISDDNSSPEKPATECYSHFNGISVQIPPCNQFESKSFDRGSQSARLSISNLDWNMNDCSHSPNPTAPRSIWHRNRTSSSSFSYRSKLWPDGRSDMFGNGLADGSKKPRSQVSYLLPFGGYDFSSKPRSHHRKGRSYKRSRSENERLISSHSKSPRRRPEFLSCDANVLITEGDRGWRECGAQVVLEFVDHKDWRLLVKLSGVTKYSYKAYQFLQPGTTNRHTHAMMWRGGKDWILEFPDRCQWARFKEIHEECYNRNIRAASVKTIPIPGVRLIEESDDGNIEVPFVRGCPKYYRQVEADVEMALNPSRVVYDIESDDEEWIASRLNSSSEILHNTMEVSVDMFERAMDMFEKVAYAQQRDDFTADEIEELMVEIGPVDVIKDIFEHWKQKRQRKGMPLIRQLQPPLWERYQKQLKEWEQAMHKAHNLPNGCSGKGTLMEKPPMFAFCLRPRGLIVPNKGSKQRSHRRVATGGHNYGFYRDQDGLHNYGRRSNGYEERGVGYFQNHETSDASTWLQTSTRVISPREAVSSGYLSMSSDGSEKNQHQRFHKSKVRKIGMLSSPRESQMMAASYNQRTGKRNGTSGWNVGFPEWPSQKQYQKEGFQRLRVEQLDGSEFDEFRLRDASGAAQHASNMAKLKREKAQRLLYKADLAIHKATVALMIAEAIKAASPEDISEDE